MPFALRRFMGSRTCPINDTKTVLVQAVGHGEMAGRIQGTVRVVSLPSYNQASIYTSIFGNIEFNASLMFVPWNIAASYTPTVDSPPSLPAKTEDWDKLMKRLLLVYGSTSSEFYASDPDNPNKLALEDSPRNERDDSGDDKNKERVSDPDLGLGPTGLLRLYNSEQLLANTSKLDLSKDISSPSYSSETSLQDAVFSSAIDFNTDLNVSGPGFLIFSITRYNTQATPGYATSYGNDDGVTPAVPNADRIRFLNAYFNGDMTRVKDIIADRTSVLGQYARAFLFRGDTAVHPISDSSEPIVGSLWQDDSPLRPNDILVTCKLAMPFSTPYTIIPELL